VGVPDEKYGEVVGAFVVPAKGWVTNDGAQGTSETSSTGKNVLREEDIQKWVKENLSGHLVPKYVWWTDGYPKTASGKIQKYKLRDIAAELAKKS
jgi:acyl-coenzyme A synthetase/AMP-(fatty) acid ligase